MNAISAKMANVGKVMTIAGAAITAAFGLTVKAAIDFNKEVANIASLIPGSTKRVDELKSAIRDMAVTVGKDTTDLAQGAYQVISAWGDTADTVGILEIAAKAATAGVATTTDAIDLLSAVTKGYGDTSIEAVQKVSDLAFQTVTLGQTTFPELAGSIGKVTPLAASLGLGMDELFAVMATGTGVTGKAAEVSTQLRGIMQSLISPTADMTKLLGEKGYASGEAMLADLGLAGALDVIKSAADATNTPLQKYISSIEGQTLALALTGTQADTYIEKLAAMRNSTGLTDIAFKEQTEGINAAGFAFQQAKIQIAVFTQEIGDKLLPMLVPLIQKFTEIVGKIRDWAEENKPLAETIVKFTAIAGGIMVVLGPILIAIPLLIKAFAGLKVAIVAIKVVMTAMTGPIGIIILAVGALALAWTTNFGGIRDFTIAVVEKVTEALGWLWDKVKWVLEKLGLYKETVIETITPTSELAIATEEAGKKAGEAAKGVDTLADSTEELGKKIEKTIEAGKKLIPVFDDLESALKIVDDVAKGAGITLDEFRKKQEAVANATESLKDKIFELTHTAMEIAIKKLDEEKQSYIDLGMSIEEVNKWYDLEIAKLNEANKVKDKAIDKNIDLIDINEDLADSYDDTGKELDKLIEKTETYSKGLMTISEMIASSTINLGGYRAAYEKVGGAFGYGPRPPAFGYGPRPKTMAELEIDFKPLIEPLFIIVKNIDKLTDVISKIGNEITKTIVAGIEKISPKIDKLTIEITTAIEKLDRRLQIGFKDIVDILIAQLKYLKQPITISRNVTVSGIKNIVTLGGLPTSLDISGIENLVGNYQTGTPYVPRTGLAMVHKGEEINPPGQRSYDYRKSYSSNASINIQPGAINIVTPKFSSTDGQELFRQFERQIKIRGLKLVRV